MRNSRKRFIIPLVALLCLVAYFVYTLFDTDSDESYSVEILDAAVSDLESNIFEFKTTYLTYRRYGKNIIYYDFFKIPDNLVLDRKMELPKDLKKYLDTKWNNPKIENPERFEKEIWKEADKLGYAPDQLKSITVKEAIMTVVKIVAARLTYHDVDWDRRFIKKYGRSLPEDVYFHLGLGDCDKYRDITMAAFNIIKKLNPKLQNIYLSKEELGGNPGTYHAWVSILIPQDSCLILSHVDPTFYDSNGLLEADEFHICLEDDIFIARFYREFLDIHDAYACKYLYQLMYEMVLKIKSEKWQERLLNDMSFVNCLLINDESMLALKRALWVLEQYEARGFVEHLDQVLYYVYKAYQKVGDELKAKKYKKRLLKEFPKSYWTKCTKR